MLGTIFFKYSIDNCKNSQFKRQCKDDAYKTAEVCVTQCCVLLPLQVSSWRKDIFWLASQQTLSITSEIFKAEVGSPPSTLAVCSCSWLYQCVRRVVALVMNSSSRLYVRLFAMRSLVKVTRHSTSWRSKMISAVFICMIFTRSLKPSFFYKYYP